MAWSHCVFCSRTEIYFFFLLISQSKILFPQIWVNTKSILKINVYKYRGQKEVNNTEVKMINNTTNVIL